MRQHYDVLIVGAGPAGLSAGIVFGSQGLRVLICERKRLPVDKACGEGIMPTGVSHLDRIGVCRKLPPGNYFFFRGVRYFSRSGKSASGVFREGPGLGIPRLELSMAIHKRAQEIPAVEICDGLQVRGIERENGRVRVLVGTDWVSTRLIVGADGLNSAVRRWTGLEGPRGAYQRWGARQHFSIAPWSDFVEVYWGNGVEAYITPCGENQVNVAFLWDRSRYKSLQGGDALIPSLLSSFPEVQRRLKTGYAMDIPRAVGSMQQLAKAPVADGVILIGDAAGYLDAITGEGISLATAQALAAGDAVAPILAGSKSDRDSLTSRDLAAYARSFKAIVKPYYRMTRLALLLSRHIHLADLAVHLLAWQPRLFQNILSANMGQTSWALPWGVQEKGSQGNG